MFKKSILLLLVLSLLAVFEAGFLLAGEPAGYIFKAQLQPTEDGRLEFHADDFGETALIYWNLDKDDEPKPGSHKGEFSANPGGPPFCNCPNAANTCQCIIQPSGVFDLNRR